MFARERERELCIWNYVIRCVFTFCLGSTVLWFSAANCSHLYLFVCSEDRVVKMYVHSTSLHVWVCVCVCECMRACVCVSMHAYVCVCVCACMHVGMCVCYDDHAHHRLYMFFTFTWMQLCHFVWDCFELCLPLICFCFGVAFIHIFLNLLIHKLQSWNLQFINCVIYVLRGRRRKKGK